MRRRFLASLLAPLVAPVLKAEQFDSGIKTRWDNTRTGPWYFGNKFSDGKVHVVLIGPEDSTYFVNSEAPIIVKLVEAKHNRG